METILIIVEGAQAEPKIIDNIKKIFLSDKIIVKILYGTSIYHLYKKIKKDEDMDIIEILKEMSNTNKNILKNISRRYVSSVFLFFDQDSHASNSSESKLKELLEYFDNENDKGKLYVSYPMVEALRDINNLSYELVNQCDFYWNTIENINYKSYATNKIRSISFLSVYQNYTIDIWNIINKFNWTKANLLINKKFDLPSYNELITFTQERIYLEQLKLMNASNDKNTKKIITLSAFSFFIANYLKREIIERTLKKV